ncbi:hypothetical protein ACO22_01503 [Paracoccidioides brasiliensis]|uniref:Uncharacterized protein n=1 Tax=Paracoccidioides brasiliensis TaxID=121759 RepID=A0A1D2JLF5_PARBR|nr:hypothetical protein ACO22_01503 [Paracoccidioides brasiliensis]
MSSALTTSSLSLPNTAPEPEHQRGLEHNNRTASPRRYPRYSQLSKMYRTIYVEPGCVWIPRFSIQSQDTTGERHHDRVMQVAAPSPSNAVTKGTRPCSSRWREVMRSTKEWYSVYFRYEVGYKVERGMPNEKGGILYIWDIKFRPWIQEATRNREDICPPLSASVRGDQAPLVNLVINWTPILRTGDIYAGDAGSRASYGVSLHTQHTRGRLTDVMGVVPRVTNAGQIISILI